MSSIAFLLCVTPQFAFQIGNDMYTPIQTIHGVNSNAWKERRGVGRTDKMCSNTLTQTYTTTNEPATKPASSNSSMYFDAYERTEKRTETKWYPSSLLRKHCVYPSALLSNDRRFNATKYCTNDSSEMNESEGSKSIWTKKNQTHPRWVTVQQRNTDKQAFREFYEMSVISLLERRKASQTDLGAQSVIVQVKQL